MLTSATRRLFSLATLISLLLSSSCGDKKKSDGGGGGYRTTVEQSFDLAAAGTRVPVRLMLAVAYLESRLSPANARAKYVSLNDRSQKVFRGTIMTETAFGLSFNELNSGLSKSQKLDPIKPESATLARQSSAYANWLAKKVEDLHLSPNPHTSEDYYNWLTTLAALHRKGVAQRRNVQVVFARELMQVLNEGFIWQDPTNGEVVRFAAQNPPLTVEAFPPNGQQWMKLDVQDGQFFGIDYLRLATKPTGETRNLPRKIEVIHCPLSLSACLELQTRSEESDIHLSAHYIVPPDRSIFDYVVQVADQRESVVITDNLGEDVATTDKIVIMLVGNSGRNVDGSRAPVIPTWFSSKQLEAMGRLINDICSYLQQKNPDLVKYDECTSVKGDLGVRFRHQGSSEDYRWGEIADFEPTIFEAYVRNYSGLDSEVAFQFAGNNREFNAGAAIPLTLLFNVNVTEVDLERLVRCRSGKVVWEKSQSEPVMNATRFAFTKTLYDSGPNANGDQFFRAKVYGRDGNLIGWAIDRVTLRRYEVAPKYASDESCRF